jgi:dihydrofolate reductase
MKIFIIAALTADGFIGRDSDHLSDWTSKADKHLFIKLTKEAGAIVMGSRTFATIGRALPGRRMIVYTSRPEHISTPGVETTTERPKDLVDRLTKEHVPGLAICGGREIYTLFMNSGLVQELYVTVSPVLFGSGISLFGNVQITNLELLEEQLLDDATVLLHYKVKVHESA